MAFFDNSFAKQRDSALGLARLDLISGDFFTDALPVADCYILMEVIHDWADSEATAILAAVQRAAPSRAPRSYRRDLGLGRARAAMGQSTGLGDARSDGRP